MLSTTHRSNSDLLSVLFIYCNHCKKNIDTNEMKYRDDAYVECKYDHLICTECITKFKIPINYDAKLLNGEGPYIKVKYCPICIQYNFKKIHAHNKKKLYDDN